MERAEISSSNWGNTLGMTHSSEDPLNGPRSAEALGWEQQYVSTGTECATVFGRMAAQDFPGSGEAILTGTIFNFLFIFKLILWNFPGDHCY